MTAVFTLGPTAFAALVWGSVALVLVGFGYIVRSLFTDR